MNEKPIQWLPRVFIGLIVASILLSVLGFLGFRFYAAHRLDRELEFLRAPGELFGSLGFERASPFWPSATASRPDACRIR